MTDELGMDPEEWRMEFGSGVYFVRRRRDLTWAVEWAETLRNGVFESYTVSELSESPTKAEFLRAIARHRPKASLY